VANDTEDAYGGSVLDTSVTIAPDSDTAPAIRPEPYPGTGSGGSSMLAAEGARGLMSSQL
jgi:hypothetical protein